MGRGDAAIGGADGDAPRPRRAGEALEATTGQPPLKFLRVGKNFFPDAQPGLANVPFQLFPNDIEPPYPLLRLSIKPLLNIPGVLRELTCFFQDGATGIADCRGKW